jgi:acetyl esterase/lipase
MIHKKIYINDSSDLYTYILDGEISYQVKRERPAIIICPGGGYLMTATKEGEAVAAEFMGRGYHCFVLKYSTYFKERMTEPDIIPEINNKAQYPTQVLELAQAIHIIHQNAKEWNIDVSNIFLMGFSAGGHVVSSLGNMWNKKEFLSKLSFTPEKQELKPRGLVLGYPMLHGDITEYMIENVKKDELLQYQSDYINKVLYGTRTPSNEQVKALNMQAKINADTPSTFIWSVKNDRVLDTKIMTRYINKLIEKDIDCEYHLFEQGAHGLGLANEFYAKSDNEINLDVNLWVELATNWMKFQQKK